MGNPTGPSRVQTRGQGGRAEKGRVGQGSWIGAAERFNNSSGDEESTRFANFAKRHRTKPWNFDQSPTARKNNRAASVTYDPPSPGLGVHDTRAACRLAAGKHRDGTFRQADAEFNVFKRRSSSSSTCSSVVAEPAASIHQENSIANLIPSVGRHLHGGREETLFLVLTQ